MELSLNGVTKALERAFKKTAEDLGAKYTEVIKTEGYFPTHPNSDIVDTGALRDSQEIIFKGGVNVEYKWNVPYAFYVHEGYTTRSGTVVQGRPWSQHGLNIFQLGVKFAINLGNEFR